MGERTDSATFALDFTLIQTIGAVALNRWAHKRHLSARLKISEDYGVPVRTVDNWVQGRAPIPQTILAQLVRDLDEGFALEIVRELARQGEFKMLARIFTQHINRILEAPYAGPSGNTDGRCAHPSCSADTAHGLDSNGRAFQG